MINIFSDKAFYKKLSGIAFPIAIQAFLLACVGASDTIMLGRLEQTAMAAVSLATQIQFVQNLLVIGVVEAFSILGSQYRGKEDDKTVNILFCMTLRISVIVSVIFASLCFFAPKAMMTIFTNEEILIEYGISYLRLAALSYLMTGFSQCFLALLKISNNADLTARISVFTVVLNIGLNAILIFGLLGMPKMGVKGAAVATTISRIVEMIASVYYSMSDKKYRPDLSLIAAHDKLLWHDFRQQLIPLMLAYVIWTFGLTSYSVFMGHMGVDATAANSVVTVIRNLVHCFTKGLANGSVIVVGNELGSGNLKRAKVYGDRLLILSVICGLFTAALTILLILPSLSIIKLSPVATEYFKKMMYIQALYMLGCSFNSVAINGMFAAGGDTKFDCYSLATVMWGMAIPLAALGTFVFNWTAPLVFACTCLDEVGKIPWTFYHYKKGKWIKDLTR